MLETLTIESFQPHVGTSFWLYSGDHKVEMRLLRVAKVMESERARLKRNPFSLFFLAPMIVPQGTHRLKHEAFGDGLDIFLVPVGQQPDGFLHEAVFT